MSTDRIIVLAMHGVPPAGFPNRELNEFFALHARFEHASPSCDPAWTRHKELEEKLRDWPRTKENDAYHAASYELARTLSCAAGYEVVVGFNEFCAPTLDQALDLAVASKASSVLVVTPMMTGGGEHSEKDIPSAISRARQRHPGKRIVYAWPFPVADVAAFLAAQVAQFSPPNRA